MTQEELDALMEDQDLGSFDDELNEGIEEEISEDENVSEDIASIMEEDIAKSTATKEDSQPAGYNDKTAHQWPLPATNENKMVHQLDDVTKESEEKASEIFDIIEVISSDMMDKEENVANVIEILNSNIELFTTLNAKFPEVEAFKTQLDKNQAAVEESNGIVDALQNSGDAILNVMDIMQYQDIHRQKIERVINVMRALSNYMNTLFEGKIDDDKRVSSAQHIAGDTHNDTASNDDIEALLAQFGN